MASAERCMNFAAPLAETAAGLQEQVLRRSRVKDGPIAEASTLVQQAVVLLCDAVALLGKAGAADSAPSDATG